MTTPTDFRALCAELATELEEWIDGYLISDYADECTDAAYKLIECARAALAEPQQGAPSVTLPLWRVMRHAYDQSSAPTALADAADPETGDCLTDRYGYAAEIEALRDYILPPEPEPWLVDSPESMNSIAVTAMYAERQRLRALLTNEARIARREP